MSDQALQNGLSVIAAGLAVSFILACTVARVERRRPGLRIALPVAVGVLARIAGVIVVDGTGLTRTLRGGDETTYLTAAKLLAKSSWSSPGWTDATIHTLHVAIFAAQMKLFDFQPTALRMTQIGLATIGLILLLAAVYQLAGASAARLAAWIMMLEPTSVFFDGAIQKEPAMLLAIGLAVLGCVTMWTELSTRGLATLGAGCAIAVATRGYAGGFLVAGCALLLLHAAIRKMDSPTRALPIAYAVVIAIAVATPALYKLSSPASLQTLQISQNANTRPGTTATSQGPNGANLALKPVDFSTRGKVIVNLPGRIYDLLLQPYPWQLANLNQALGAIGSLIALTAFALLLSYAWRSRRRFVTRTAPMLYPLIFLIVAYALSVGNAGTGFRYRAQIVTLSFAMLIILRSQVVTEPRRRSRPARSVADVTTRANRVAA